MIFGTFPLKENFSNLKTVSSFPTMSENDLGRYFSILNSKTDLKNLQATVYY